MIFVTDIHDALIRARALSKPVSERMDRRPILVVGGDLTSFGGRVRARRILSELALSFRRVVAVPGNTDLPEVASWLERLGLSVEGRARVIDGIGFVGCGGSNRTPMLTPNERDEEEIAACLEKAFADLRSQGDFDRVVVVSHCPPKDTATDCIHGGLHVGSSALRDFLVCHEVDLCLCGHIHESIGTDRLGKTLVCNPGALAWGRYAHIRWQGAYRPVCDLMELQVDRLSGLVEGAVGAARKLTGYAFWRISGLVDSDA